MQANLELNEDEREILRNGLEVLSPDTFEAQDALEVLTQRLLGVSEEPGDIDLELDQTEMELSIAALEIVSPEDYDMQELADDLCDRFRVAYDSMEGGNLEL